LFRKFRDVILGYKPVSSLRETMPSDIEEMAYPSIIRNTSYLAWIWEQFCKVHRQSTYRGSDGVSRFWLTCMLYFNRSSIPNKLAGHVRRGFKILDTLCIAEKVTKRIPILENLHSSW